MNQPIKKSVPIRKSAPIRKYARAKINLYLHITGRQEDGYHLLESVIGFADIADELEFLPDERISLSIRGHYAKSLSDEENLIMKAAKLLAGKYKTKQGAKIRLIKNLPVSAGLGGGSADAAAAIEGLCELWKIRMSNKAKIEIGMELGADVPVCSYSMPALVRGVGEKIKPLENFPSFPIVIVNPNIPLSTEKIFKMGFKKFSQQLEEIPATKKQWVNFLKEQRNDLEANAIKSVPVIRKILDKLESNEGAIMSRMSGSGASCFALFADDNSASRAARRIKKAHPKWWVSHSHLK